LANDKNEIYGSGDLYYFLFWQLKTLKIISFFSLGKILPVKTDFHCVCLPQIACMIGLVHGIE
jgi:hypothetical protein